jgi:NADPH:quinone reductase-like Zn-dependent oxidoreductase
MRAVQFSSHGDPGVLEVVDVPEPHAGPGQVRVVVRAVAVNPFETKQRRGLVGGDLPLIPGSDVAGIVDEVGDGVTDVAAGDAVFGSAVRQGYAESVVLKAWASKPDRLAFEEAAGYVTAAETAARALDAVDVGEGTTVVIAGASGGVGSAAVQLAVARGARVIGTASDGNHDYLRSLGAEPIPHDGIRALRDPVDAGFDTAGKGAVADLIALADDPQQVVTIADFGDHGAQTSTQQSAWYALALAADLHEQGRFSLPVEQAYALEDAPEAHRVSEAGHVRGKLILTL